MAATDVEETSGNSSTQEGDQSVYSVHFNTHVQQGDSSAEGPSIHQGVNSGILPFSLSSIGIFVDEALPQGQGHDFDIKPDTPVFNIIHVVIQALF